jgi:hypothetical protein
VAIALIFGNAGDRRKRITCKTWTIRSDSTFEAGTNNGTIQFRRDDIQFIEPSYDENNSHISVCVGNLQRFVWIEFPNETEALQFIAQMEHHLRHAKF